MPMQTNADLARELAAINRKLDAHTKLLGTLGDWMRITNDRLAGADRLLDRLMVTIEEQARTLAAQNLTLAAHVETLGAMRDVIGMQQETLARFAEQAGWTHCPTCGRCSHCHQEVKEHA